MLQITNLKSGYNGMEVLKGIDFRVEQGEIVAIIGPNGAGKSTLLKSIFNLCEIYTGKIILKDKDITRLPTNQLISEGISYVPQGRQIFSNLTVKENLEMGAYIQKNKTAIQDLIDNKIYRLFPFLREKEKDLAGNLSGGQQQMLALARALMPTSKLLLLDEPSLGLSPRTTKEIFAKIVQISQNGVSIIIVEQNAKQAVAVADRTYVLENGQVALTGGREILENPKIKNIYFGG